jgi:2'-5' RNA ligase
MRSLPVNVILVPDSSTQQRARKLGQILDKNYKNHYTIADAKFIPHATVYQAQYPAKNLGKIKEKIGKLVANFKPFKVSIGPYQNHHKIIWWNILENKNLTQLHYQVLNELNPLREGLLLSHLTPTSYITGEKFTDEEAEVVRKYGAIVAGNLFQPHITLAKLKVDVEESRLIELLGKAESNFTVSEIWIGKMGDFGTVVKILEKFPMKTS